MKTKLLLTAIFLLSFLENGFSQQYNPLLNNSWWVVYDWVSCCRPPVVKTIEQGTDVVIGAHTYKKFVDPFPQWSVSPSVLMDTIYLREEIDTQKVYKIVNGADVLLYDFSLENGDEITLNGVAFIASTDEIPANGSTRKRITLESVPLFNGQHVYQKWIEGVGTNAHPFYPDFYMYAEVFSSGGGYRVNTQCSFQDQTHIYGDSEYCSSFLSGLAVDENQFAAPEITFSPNPMTSALTIDSNLQLQNASLKLYNPQGQLVREIANLSGKKITVDRENLSRGLYFAQLLENGKPAKTAKILVD